jgi:Flp pilus assembly protein TadD
LDLYPKDLEALTGLARLYAAQHRWLEVLQVTTLASELVPYVELLGYKADAERALDLPDQAAQTEDLIGVVAQLGKAKGIYDRALVTYYVEHGIHLKDALLIARKELATRDDLYTEDTLAWALVANGRWPEAQKAIDKALQYGTEDPLLHFHAGLIALQSGDREAARQHLAQALQLNPQFHAQYANQARQTLADLTANT